MHESRLVTDILTEIDRVAAANGVDHVSEIRIEIGALSHVTPDGLARHLSMMSTGTVADGAELAITKSIHNDAPDALEVRLVSIVAGGD